MSMFHFCQGWIQHMSRFLDIMSMLTYSSVQVATMNVRISNVFRTGPVIEPEKLPVHRSNRWLNRGRTDDVINM